MVELYTVRCNLTSIRALLRRALGLEGTWNQNLPKFAAEDLVDSFFLGPKDYMNSTALVKIQFWILILISVFVILAAPSIWYYTPDSGIYIGTAESMVERHEYHFNGHPNLLYYPGFPSLLSWPIMLFGENFHVLHLFCAAMVVASIWLARTYFASSRYGLAGIVVPVIMASTTILQAQAFSILSDGSFLTISLGALVLWRIYVEKSFHWALLACFVLVAFAPMVRFHGLFLCAAFSIALFLQAMRNSRRSPLNATMAIIGGAATLIPFGAWTLRNFEKFTPHTFNVANSYFFGLHGLPIYAPGFSRVDWMGAKWKYPLHCIGLSIIDLGKNVFGKNIVKLFPNEVMFVLLIGIASFGILRWFKLATHMERAYVFLCLLFALWWVGRGYFHYSTTRQVYLPILPFILITAGLGMGLIHEKLATKRYQMLSTTIIIVLVLTLILSHGVSSFISFASRASATYYKNANIVLSKVKNYMDEKALPGVPVATTDWGVMPFTLKRTCYQVINDDSHLLTLGRLSKYRTSYLVILDHLSVFPPYARKMVKDLPQLFTLLFEVHPDGKGPSAAVYGIDLRGVRAFLNTVPKH